MKKIILLMVMVLLFVPLVSAINWDNGLKYEKDDLKVIIENGWFFGIGEWFGLNEEIGTAELKSHSSVDEVRKVGGGTQVVMWYDIDFKEKYKKGLGKVYFTDKRTGEEIDRNYSFVYWGEKERNVYGKGNCNYFLNGTESGCEQVITGIETYETWLPYNSKDIPKGNIRMGLQTYVEVGDYIDGVWTIAGKKVKKHAVWTAELNVGLMRAFDLIYGNEGGVIAIDSTGQGNGTHSGVPSNISTKMDYGYNYTAVGKYTSASLPASDELTLVLAYKGPTTTTQSLLTSCGEMQTQVGSIVSFQMSSDGYATHNTNQSVISNDWNLIIWRVNNATPYASIHVNNELAWLNGTFYNAAQVSPSFPRTGAEVIGQEFDFVYIWNRTISDGEVNQIWNNGNWMIYTTIFTTPPTSTLNAPDDLVTITNPNVIFNATGTDDTTLQNMSLIINGSRVSTNSSPVNNTLTQFPYTLPSASYYNWTVEACDDEDTCVNATLRGITYQNDLAITLNAPVNEFNSTSQTIIFNGTGIDDTNLINISFILNGSYNGTNSSVINNTLTQFPKTLANGFYNWTMQVCDVYSCLNATTRNFTIVSYLEHLYTYNTTSFETDSETFYVNITARTTPTNGKLIYNGTTYGSATITNTAGKDYNISRTIDIPIVTGNKGFYFNFTIAGTEYSTSSQNQTINLTNFTSCTTGTPFINISFKNETVAEELVNATIDSDWNYWLGGGSIFKTLSFANTTENLDYQFCLVGVNRTLITNVSLSYDNSISEQRSFQQPFDLTNTTTEQTLFLLPTVEGVFITFQVVTIAEQVIDGVAINVTRNSVLVETGVTDSAGLKAFFLDPDTTYGFSFFKSGFDRFTTSLAPTQTTFTITLGQGAPDIINDTTKGISYVINPIPNILENNTITEFNLTFVSSFWGLDNFELFLKNSTGDFFNSTSSTTETGGFLTQTLDTGNNTDIIMEVTWTINGNQTNITRTWLVRDFADEGFSIRTFFDDLSTYLTSNMFGLTDFGLGIILFLIIVITTGVLSVKFGITSPAGIAIIVFSMVAFFDVALGIMPNPVNAVPNFPTIFMAVVFLGTFIKEAIIR